MGGGKGASDLDLKGNRTAEAADALLLEIMRGIHAACGQRSTRTDGSVSDIDGANVAGFVKVADAMLAQGVV